MNSPTFEVKKSTIPLSGTLVRALIVGFTTRPYKGDDSWPECSIGVAQDSIAATDTYSAIIIGDPQPRYEATSRKHVVHQTDYCKTFGELFDIDGVKRLQNRETQETEVLPDVGRVISEGLSSMTLVASLSPEGLAKIGTIAKTAGAISVEIYQDPNGSQDFLGFKFKFDPSPDQRNLFPDYEGDVEVRGVVKTNKAINVSEVPNADVGASGISVEIIKPEKKAKVAEVSVIKNADLVEEAPVSHLKLVETIDINESREQSGYRLPPLRLVNAGDIQLDTEGEYSEQIKKIFSGFGISARVERVNPGPTITQYEISINGSVKVSRIAGMADDIQMGLGVESIRIQAPIPGKKTIGIEVPNSKPQKVMLRDVMANSRFMDLDDPLKFVLGMDIGGNPRFADLTKMPHLLIAGTTNSGKSIGIATILTSLLMRNSPKRLKLVLIDPKKVEFSFFDEIPHLLCPVITDTSDAPGILRAVWREMDIRYEKFKEAKARNIEEFNDRVESEAEKLPFIVVVIDELSDLMIQAAAEVETSIVRLAQLARACGIHLIVATQRPSADIVTSLIKANIPSRISFAVASGVDSRVILDQSGAEKLLGRGDMLYSPVEAGGKATRIQCTYVSTEEIEAVCAFWRDQSPPHYILKPVEPVIMQPGEGDEDSLYEEAVEWTIERKEASTSTLQRKFSIGFQRASRLLDAMEANGIVGPKDGAKPRKVICQ